MSARFLVAGSAILALALASCAGNTPSSPPVMRPANAKQGKLSFSIVVPAASPAAVGRRPAFVSPATRSVSFQVGSGPVQVVALTPGSASCPYSNGGYACTVYADVPAGSAQLTVATYASTDGTGAVLSENTIAIVIVAGANNPVTVTLNGVAAGFSLAANPSSVSAGTSSLITVTWAALDASGNTIVGPGSVVNASGAIVSPSLAVSDSADFTVGAPSGNTWTVNYDGVATISPVTFTVSSTGVSSADAIETVKRSALSASPGTLALVQTGPATFNVTESGFRGSYIVSSDATGVVTASSPVSSTSDTTQISVNAVTAGSANITVSDGSGQSVVVAIGVTLTPVTIQSRGAHR